MELTLGNPFFNRGRIDDARYFYGRERTLRDVFNLLGKSTSQSVSIVGQRKIGKSSFLQHIMRREVKARYVPDPDELIMVALNFEGLAYFSELECLQKLMWETHTTLAQAGIHPGDELKIDRSASTTLRIVEGMNRLFEYLRKQRRKLIFVFDEFEISCGNAHLSISFFNTLRSFATSYGVAYVVATRQELWQLPHYRLGRSSPFFNYFTTIYLGLFEDDEARALISTLGGDVGLASETPFLLGRGGRFPFFLQILCWYLYEKMALGPVDDAEREKASQQYLAQVNGYFEVFWEYLTEEEKAAAAKIAFEDLLLTEEGASLESLRRKALVYVTEGRPQLVNEAFRDFVRTAATAARPAGS